MGDRLTRIQNRILARILALSPKLSDRWARTFSASMPRDPVPWAEITTPVPRRRLALVTTAGVHLSDQPPFDMADPAGDATFRAIPDGIDSRSLRITHDYYDHSDAEQDPNIVFPLDRLHELVTAGKVGSAAARHFSFMGHILPPHVSRLVKGTAPQVARLLESDSVNSVLLTPA